MRQAHAEDRDATPVAHWGGPALLGTALAAILGLGALRDRLPIVPDLAWVLAIAVLLISGGVRMAATWRVDAVRVARQQFVARGAVVAGVAALTLGILSVRSAAESWSDAARASGALAFCAAFALLPFGVSLRRRVVRVARLHAEAGAGRRAWLATATAPAPAPSAPGSVCTVGTEPSVDR